MRLEEAFERVVVLSLHYRKDRRRELGRHLMETEMADPGRLQWVRAVSGDLVGPPPAWWNAGNGAWGCLCSHARVMQDAAMDGVDSVLILEDDAVFSPEAPELLDRLMEEVPPDWGQLYLGGQHLARPQELAGRPFVLRGRNINRTHAYAARGDRLGQLHAHVWHAPDYIRHGKHSGWHVDHQLGLAHVRGDWPTYAPAWWLAGQREGSSNISGRMNCHLWWQPEMYTRRLPVVWIPPDTSEADREAAAEWLHCGHHCKPGTLEDVGLDDTVGDPGRLNGWIRMIVREAGDRQRIPGLQHPEISLESVRTAWHGPVAPLSEADLPEWSGYPYNGLIPHPLNLDLPVDTTAPVCRACRPGESCAA